MKKIGIEPNELYGEVAKIIRDPSIGPLKKSKPVKFQKVQSYARIGSLAVNRAPPFDDSRLWVTTAGDPSVTSWTSATAPPTNNPPFVDPNGGELSCALVAGTNMSGGLANRSGAPIGTTLGGFADVLAMVGVYFVPPLGLER